MLGEADSVEAVRTACGGLDVQLGRDVGIRREQGVDVQVDEHGAMILTFAGAAWKAAALSTRAGDFFAGCRERPTVSRFGP
jgi:hypothetical protein